MSVIIKGMQMPKSCMECPMFSVAGCKATMTMFNELTNVAVRVKGCPLVELPEKHGRLIDADKLKKEWEKSFYKKIVDALMDDAETFLESEE